MPITRRVPVAWGPLLLIALCGAGVLWWVDRPLLREIVEVMDKLFDAMREGMRSGSSWLPIRPGSVGP